MSVALTTPSSVLRGKVSVDTGSVRLAELVPTAYELTNVLVGQAAQREQQAGRQISCRAGCGARWPQRAATGPTAAPERQPGAPRATPESLHGPPHESLHRFTVATRRGRGGFSETLHRLSGIAPIASCAGLASHGRASGLRKFRGCPT